MTAIGIGVLWTYRDALRPATAKVVAAPLPAALAEASPMVLAVGGPTSRQVSALITPLALARGGAVHVVHVVETDLLPARTPSTSRVPRTRKHCSRRASPN
jgi:hypothetical protein